MTLVELDVVEVTSSHSVEVYDLHFYEKEGDRRISINIGITEAKNILVLISGIETRRPSTYALLKNVSISVKLSLKQVVIRAYQDGIYFADMEMYSETEDKIVTFDARPSDAVAMAIMCNAPIFINEKLLNQNGTHETANAAEKVFNISEVEDFIEESTPLLEKMTLTELNDLINKAIENEDFEYASIIQKHINIKSNS